MLARRSHAVSTPETAPATLIANENEVNVDNGRAVADVPLEVARITQSLFKELAALATMSRIECNNGLTLAKVADKLEEFHQHFTPAVLVQTREFQCVRNTLRRNNSLIDNISPTEPQICHEFES